MLAYIIGIFLVSACASIEGLEYNEAEFPAANPNCPKITVDPSLNATWLKSVDLWILPLWSKKELFLSIKLSATPEEFASTTEDSVRKSCFMVDGIKEAHSKVSFYGLNKKFFVWEASKRFNRDGIIDWFQNKNYIATSQIVLTDNTSYFLAIQQLSDGSNEFFLATTQGKIPAEEMDKVHKKLESLGFPKASMYAVNSDCENDEYVKSVRN